VPQADKPITRLRKFLEGQLALIEKSESPRMMGLKACLKAAVEGLHALKYGEVMPMFAPSKTSDHGVTPYSALKYRMIAVGFVDLLQKKGNLAGKAKHKVADAYGVSVETIKDWQQDPGKTADPWMQKFRKDIADSTDSHAQIREALYEAAKKYIVANKKKKVVKQKKTKEKTRVWWPPAGLSQGTRPTLYAARVRCSAP
jgi:hypothetical protein